MSNNHVAELFHLCVEFVVEVLTKVGGELFEALTQCDVFLMKRSLRDEEVVLGDISGIITLLLEKWVQRRAWPIHHNQVG